MADFRIDKKALFVNPAFVKLSGNNYVKGLKISFCKVYLSLSDC